MNPIVLAALAQVGSGIVGNMMSQGDRNAAINQQIAMYNAYKNLQIPDIDKQKLQSLLIQSQGTYNPQQETAENLGSNYWDQVQADQEMQKVQKDRLTALQQLANTGMTPEEQAQADKLQLAQAAQAQSSIADINRQAAQSGMASSGASLLAKLQAAQASRNQNAADKNALLSQMFNRKLQAGQQSSDLAGHLDQTQYNRAMGLASAKLGLDQFNQQNRAAIQQRNIAGLNTAQQMNLAEKQRIADQNVALQNKQQQYNKELMQQEYENRLNRLRGMAGQSSSVAGAYQNRAKETADMWGGIGKGMGQTIGAYNQSQNNTLGEE